VEVISNRGKKGTRRGRNRRCRGVAIDGGEGEIIELGKLKETA